MDTQNIITQLIEGGTVETYAAELAERASAPTPTTRECALVLSAIAEIQNRIGGWRELWALEDATEAKRKTLFAETIARQLASEKASGKSYRPTSQYWDDDAPGGVVYE